MNIKEPCKLITELTTCLLLAACASSQPPTAGVTPISVTVATSPTAITQPSPSASPTIKRGWLTSIALSPDGHMLAIGTTLGVFAFDPGSGNLLWSLTDPPETMTSLAFSPDSTVLAVGSEKGKLSLVNSETGAVQVKHTDHNGQIESIAWSSDGSHLASGSLDYSAIIWDIASESPGLVLDNHTPSRFSSIATVAWSPDGSILAMGDFGGEVIFWNAMTGEVQRVISAYTPDVAGVESGIRQIVWSPDGQCLLISGQALQTSIWNVESGEKEREVDEPLRIHHIAWVTQDEPIGVYVQPGQILVRNLQTGAVLHTLAGIPEYILIRPIALNLSSKLLAYDGTDHIVRIWSLATDELLVTIEGFSE